MPKDNYSVTVVGLGKIGLPLAVQCASKNLKVIGADVNQKTVDLVNQATCPFPGEADLDWKLTQVVEENLLSATTSTSEAVSKSNVVIVVVPLYVNDAGVPDFTWMDDATTEIAKGLKPGTLVCYETTLPVGTTRNRFGKELERISGLKMGEDFFLAFSPERVFSGEVFRYLGENPKIVGGVNEDSTLAAIEFYESVLEFRERNNLPKPNGVWNVGDSETSELTKLAETTYRDVNIGLANQFALYARSMGIDFSKVIEACNSSWSSQIHNPGIAVGGHCIPIYPQMYLWNDPSATIVSAARRQNSEMPMHAIDILKSEYGELNGKRVLILGVAYRGGVKETAFSGIFPLNSLLETENAMVVVSDPLYGEDELLSLGLHPWNGVDPVDCVIIQADHSEYRQLDEKDLPGAQVLLDGRQITTASNFKNLRVLYLDRV